MAEAVYKHDDGDATKQMLDELIGLYVASATSPSMSFQCMSVAHSSNAPTSQCERNGFELVSVRIEDRLIGFSFGLRFGPGKW